MLFRSPQGPEAPQPAPRAVWASGGRSLYPGCLGPQLSLSQPPTPGRPAARHGEVGGSFVYPLGPEHVCVGFVTGLEYTDSRLSPHDLLQEFKTHPLMRRLLEGGERVSWGAKTIPSGGYYSVPDSLALPGALVTGVWLGNDDNSPTKHVAGGSLPVEIWSRFMKQSLAKTKPIMLPASDVPQTDLFSVLGRALFGAQSQNNGVPQKGPLILQPQTDAVPAQ